VGVGDNGGDGFERLSKLYVSKVDLEVKGKVKATSSL
jgi:NAD(P)H-hydrate repair Nnr-like enzyme with NAD(P)H-hydrate epimerase domain